MYNLPNFLFMISIYVVTIVSTSILIYNNYKTPESDIPAIRLVLTTENTVVSAIAVSSNGQTIGVTSNENGSLFVSRNYGNNFTSRESIRDWTSIACSSSGSYMFAAVFSGFLYSSANFGQTWLERGTSQQWTSIYTSASGEISYATTNGNEIYKSSDFGETWTSLGASPSLVWSSICCSSEGLLVYACAEGGQPIYKSTDAGTSWNPVGYVNNWLSIRCSTTGQYCIAGSNSGIFEDSAKLSISSDFGETWTPVESPAGIESAQWFSVGMSANGATVAASSASNGLVISQDFGVTWQQYGATYTPQWGPLALSADGLFLAVAANFSEVFAGTIKHIEF
jgi:hypothetical protein